MRKSERKATSGDGARTIAGGLALVAVGDAIASANRGLLLSAEAWTLALGV